MVGWGAGMGKHGETTVYWPSSGGELCRAACPVVYM